jgi:hypothetical protein
LIDDLEEILGGMLSYFGMAEMYVDMIDAYDGTSRRASKGRLYSQRATGR